MRKIITLIAILAISFLAYAQIKQSNSKQDTNAPSAKHTNAQANVIDTPSTARENIVAENQPGEIQNQPVSNSTSADDNENQATSDEDDNQTTTDDDQLSDTDSGIDADGSGDEDMSGMDDDNSTNEDSDTNDTGSMAQPS